MPVENRTNLVTKVLIKGATGRDFGSFNIVFTDDARSKVVASTTARLSVQLFHRWRCEAMAGRLEGFRKIVLPLCNAGSLSKKDLDIRLFTSWLACHASILTGQSGQDGHDEEWGDHDSIATRDVN